MSKHEYLAYRCCMCPNIDTPQNTQCPADHPCRFVKAYRDQGRVLFVTDAFSGGRVWFTGYRKPSGALKRVCSPSLPVRKNHDEAQADLNQWAQKKGLPEAEVAS
jgi:hypothetical protein